MVWITSSFPEGKQKLKKNKKIIHLFMRLIYIVTIFFIREIFKVVCFFITFYN